MLSAVSMLRSSARYSTVMQRAAFFSSDAFTAAVEAVKKLPREPSNEDKLKLYALYKQAVIGKNTTKKPGMFDMVGKYKWEAWSSLGDMPKEDAKKKYIALVDNLGCEEKKETAASAPGEDNSVEGLTVTFGEGILTFRFNSPQRKNPITIEMYQTISNKLRAIADDPAYKAVVLTGTGDYYSSGNDLKNFQKMMSLAGAAPNKSGDLLADSSELGRVVLSDFQEAMIDFPKPLIALVNGSAVGIMVTTLGLCDAVLASENATFSTPFITLAQSPEGCSSLIFPLAMGPLVASDVLLFGRVLTAKEAAQYGLVSRVFPVDSFASESNAFVKRVATLPPNSFRVSKRLLRGSSGQPLSREKLLSVSREECKVLAKQWQGEECIAAIANFMSRKKK